LGGSLSLHQREAASSSKIGVIEKSFILFYNLREIANFGFDYLALGHWHSFQDFSQGNTKAFYCGSPEPISMDQKGSGYVEVTIHYLSTGNSYGVSTAKISCHNGYGRKHCHQHYNQHNGQPLNKV